MENKAPSLEELINQGKGISGLQTPAPASAPEPVSHTTKSIAPEQITVTKTEWEEMKKTLKRLETGMPPKIPKVNDRVAKITLYDGKVVTKIVKTWIERKFGEINKREEDRLYALIRLEDDSERTLDYLDFLNEAERIVCAIKKVDKKPVNIIHGKFQTEDLNPKGTKEGGKVFNSDEIQDVEERTDDDYTLEFIDGQRKGEQIELNHLAINL